MGIFEGFIHPALAWGVLLAGIPILIHLLNRRRHKPLPWAAMRGSRSLTGLAQLCSG